MATDAQVSLTRKVRFCASHRYYRADWSEEKNREVFGACANPYGHGHNYELEVALTGDIDPETGMVINLREVDTILQEEIVSRFDHRYINKEVEAFETVIPTTENLAHWMYERLEPIFRDRGVALRFVRLWEAPDLHAECRGEPE